MTAIRLVEDVDIEAKEQKFIKFMNESPESRKELVVVDNVCSLKDLLADTVPDGVDFVWSVTFPLSFYKCRDICQLARHMPKMEVMDKVFIGMYDQLGDQEKDFADKIYNYGSAVGVQTISKKLYDAAVDGDPRAVKMFLELKKLIGSNSVEEEADRMLKVNLVI